MIGSRIGLSSSSRLSSFGGLTRRFINSMTETVTYPGIERWKGRVAVVTGASAGMGYQLAKTLAQLGVTLSQELSPTGGKVVAIKCDVSKEEDILSMMSAIKSQLGGADICINNAGLGHYATLLDGSSAMWKEMFEVNVLGLCMVTREFIKQLRERNVDDGHVIFMNSTAGHEVGNWEGMNFYTATKQAVTALTEGLRQELRGIKLNIKITAVSPGEVITEFRPRFEQKPNPKEAIDSVYKQFDFEIHDIIVRGTQEP